MTDERSNLVRNEAVETITPIPFQFDDLRLLAKRMLEKANTQAQRLLETARRQATEIEKTAYDEGYKRGHDESFPLGLEEGRAQGEQEARVEVLAATRSLAQSLEAILEDLSRTRMTLRTAAEVDMISLAIAIAEKIVKRAVELDHEAAKANAAAAVGLTIARRDLTLHVAPEDFQAVEEYLPALKRKFDDLERVSIIADEAVGRGGVRVATAEGMVDLSVENQLQSIANSLLGGTVAPGSGEAGQNILATTARQEDTAAGGSPEAEPPPPGGSNDALGEAGETEAGPRGADGRTEN